MCGLPLTGKTTIAEYLAKTLPAELLSTDRIRREIFKHCSLEELLRSDDPLRYDIQRIFDSQPSIPEIYQQMIWRQNEMVYDQMLLRAQNILPKKNLILDGTFSKMRIRSRAYEIARAMNLSKYLLYCTCSEEAIMKRLEKRNRNARNTTSNVLTADIFQKVKSGFEDPLNDEVTIIRYDSEKLSVNSYNIELSKIDEIRALEAALMAFIPRSE